MSKLLIDIAEVIDSLHATPSYVDNGVPMVRVADINNSFLELDECLQVAYDDCLRHNSNHKPQRGDVVIARVGSFGMLSYVDTDELFCLGQNTAIITSKEYGKFIYYYLGSPLAKSFIEKNLDGSAYKSLSLKQIREFPIIDSGIDKKAVGDLLYLFDSIIANNKKLMTELEETARLIYDYWFTQFDFPDENGNPYRSSGGAMVYNETLHREIPADWEVMKLDNAADVLFGYPLATTLFGEKGTPVVRIRDISEGTFSALTSEAVDETYYTEIGDLLIGMDGNFQMAFWSRKNDIVNQRISRIRKTTFPLLPLRFQIEPYIKSRVDSVARSTVGHLSNADIRDFNLVVPPVEQNLAIFDAILSKICGLRRENQSLIELRDWLLPMLMNGQVQVGDSYEY